MPTIIAPTANDLAFPVKWLHSGMRGAPVMSGTPGAWIAVLDACLIDGFGAITPQKITVADGLATATVSAGDTFAQYAVIKVSDASAPALNGLARVLGSSNTSFAFATDAPAGEYTGAISVRYAPVGGWEKAFSGDLKAAYRSTDPDASGLYLRVDDTGTVGARVVGYEAMTDVDTGVMPFPTEAQRPGGAYAWKSEAANASARPWVLVADACSVAYWVRSDSRSYAGCTARGFGDALPASPADAFAVYLCAAGSNEETQSGSGLSSGAIGGSATGVCALARDFATRTSAALGSTRPYCGTEAAGGADGTFPISPAAAAKIRLSRRYFLEAGQDRAIVPGLVHLPYATAAIYSHLQLVDGADWLAGRKLLCVRRGPNMHSWDYDRYMDLIDVTGPWR